uniref:Uncharacterized protein n=1 Tax=Craspedostauros australis TaxID=1486917 RepID=A0A7R9WTM1_9STRA|mmetsp:Transcript_17890/g.49616  ORF Transcript_17890/g.49616 Transcript_17890/m.49616 type:complete len:168 (+) Transcript_17890:159-662(+)
MRIIVTLALLLSVVSAEDSSLDSSNDAQLLARTARFSMPQYATADDSETPKTLTLRSRAEIFGSVLKHYGPPPQCEKDEESFRINGVPGEVCSPKCSDLVPCPTDVPDGVTATPTCALENAQTGDTYCVLICDPDATDAQLRGASGGGQCGDATCQPIQGLGICTFE